MIKSNSMMVVLTGSMLAWGLPLNAQTIGLENPSTAIPPTATAIPPKWVQTIEIDPNRLPGTATPSPSQPVLCGPHRVLSITWHPDRNWMAVGIGSGSGSRAEIDGCANSGTVQIFDMAPKDPELLHTLPYATDWVESVAYSPKGLHLATAGRDTIVRIYNGTHPTLPPVLLNHTEFPVKSVAYSPERTCQATDSGVCLATAGSDAMVRIYDGMNPNSPLMILERQTNPLESVVYSPDRKHLAAGGGDRMTRIYNGRDPGSPQSTLSRANGAVRSITYSPDSAFLAVGGFDKKVRIYDRVNPDNPPRILDHATSEVRSVDYSPEDTYFLAVGGEDGMVRIYDGEAPDKPLHILDEATDHVRSVAYNREGTYLAVGGHDQYVRVYRMSSDASTDAATDASTDINTDINTDASTDASTDANTDSKNHAFTATLSTSTLAIVIMGIAWRLLL